MRWYIVNTLSGYEQKVAKAIIETAKQKGISEMFEDVVVPVENVIELKKGKKVSTSKKIFPSYIMVKMELNDLSWNIVKNIPKVSGFLGGGNKPIPVPELEVKRVLQQVEQGKIEKQVELTFDIGEVVKILDGPFENFMGVIEEVEYEKKRVKISVSIFGRSTPVELEFNQIEKSK